ncbi:30S ribosomal protein S6 [Micromonospora sp. M12]
MVILDPSLEERTVAPSLDTYLNVIRTAGGSVEKTDVGPPAPRVRDRQKAEGIYAVVDLQATPAAVAELDRQLRLNESVLRTRSSGRRCAKHFSPAINPVRPDQPPRLCRTALRACTTRR